MSVFAEALKGCGASFILCPLLPCSRNVLDRVRNDCLSGAL